MAGDWIKMRMDLQTHPKVVRIMSALRADKFRTIGGLHAVWCVFDAHSEDGILAGYTADAMDASIGWPGFAAAMQSVDWLDETPQGLTMPRFDNHNGKSAKRRASDTERKRSVRTVRNLSANEAEKTGTREEKRREEYSSSYAPPESEAKSEEEEIQAKLIQVGITKPGVAALAIATAGVQATRGVLEWLESRKVLGCLPYASGVICNRLTQAGRASLPPDQGWNCEEAADYRKAVEKAGRAARKLRETVERISITELTARHGPWIDGLDLIGERKRLESENQVWRLEPDAAIRLELMRRREVEVRNGAQT